MKNNKLSLVIAIVLALIAGLMVFAYTAGADKRALEGATVKDAYVAVSDLAAGQSLQAALDSKQVKLESFPANAVPTDAITQINSTNGSNILLNPVSKGQLILASALGDANTVLNGLSIPAGQIAVSIQLADPEHVGTFVVPGSQVAVFTTQVRTNTDNSFQFSQVLLPRALVLAVGTSTGAVEEKSKGGAIITLAVKPQDAVRVVQASRAGQMYLGLLSEGADVSGVQEVTPDNLLSK